MLSEHFRAAAARAALQFDHRRRLVRAYARPIIEAKRKHGTFCGNEAAEARRLLRVLSRAESNTIVIVHVQREAPRQ